MAPAPRQVEGDGPQLPVRPEADDARTRARAEEILAGDEYQAPEPRGKTAGDRLREWLEDRFPSFEGESSLNGVAWVISGVVVIGAIAGLTWVLATAARRRRPPEEDGDLDASIEVAPLRSPSEWGEEAARCAQAGDHRGAVRAHFRVLTSTLAERRLVSDTPGRTSGELRHDVDERVPSAAGPFGAAATLFEQVWFGDRAAGPTQTEQAAQLTRDALRAAPRRGRDDDQHTDGRAEVRPIGESASPTEPDGTAPGGTGPGSTAPGGTGPDSTMPEAGSTTTQTDATNTTTSKPAATEPTDDQGGDRP